MKMDRCVGDGKTVAHNWISILIVANKQKRNSYYKFSLYVNVNPMDILI